MKILEDKLSNALSKLYNNKVVVTEDLEESRLLIDIAVILMKAGYTKVDLIDLFLGTRYMDQDDHLKFVEFCFNRMLLNVGYSSLSEPSIKAFTALKDLRRNKITEEAYSKIMSDIRTDTTDPMWPIYLWANLPIVSSDVSYIAAAVRRESRKLNADSTVELSAQFKFLWSMLDTDDLPF